MKTDTNRSAAPVALITGASSGIGMATARVLAGQGYGLVLCGRRRERLEQLAGELDTSTHVLVFDVSQRAEVLEAVASLPEDFRQVDVLVNNAGNAHGLAPIHEGSLDDWEAMIESNVMGLLYLTRAVVPGMVERQRGHVVNLGSIAGRQAYANGAVYCASKSAVAMLTEGMRLDLYQHGIKVTNIEPGMVETEFSLVRFKGDEDRAARVYQDITPLTPQDVADAIGWVVSRPAHVVIGDVLMMPQAQASVRDFDRIGPGQQ